MVGEGQTPEKSLDVRELIGVLRRHLAIILIIAVVVTSVAAVVIYKLPDVYVSRSVVEIEPPSVPKSYKQAGVVVPTVKEIIGSLRQQVMSRESLRAVVNDLGLYEEKAPDPADPTTGKPPEGFWKRLFYRDPIERAREDIEVRIVQRHGRDFVEIAVRARAAELAKRTVQRMSDLLAARDHEIREGLVLESQAFLTPEIARAERVLEMDEKALRVFRDEHRESLPEREQEIRDELLRLTDRIELRAAELAQGEARYRKLQEDLDRLLAGKDAPVEADPRAERLAAQIRAAEELLARRRAVYTEAHPDVQAALAELARLRAELDALGQEPPQAPPGPVGVAPGEGAEAGDPTGAAGGPTPPGPPARAAGHPVDAEEVRRALDLRAASRDTRARAERLLAELSALVGALTALEGEQARDQLAIDRNEHRRAALPRTAAELRKLEEARASSASVLKELRADQDILAKALTLQASRRGSQLRTVEAAEAPLVPDEPKRVRLMAMALVAALGLGYGVGYLLDMVRDSYRNALEVERGLGVRVLAILPRLDPSDGLGAPGRRRVRGGRPLAQVMTEQLNRLRYAVLHARGAVTLAPRLVLVTSAVPGEGKSTVALGLGRAFARSLDHWALLVETDLRNPSLAARTGLDGAVGLSQHLVDERPLRNVIQRAGLEKLSVILAGPRSGDAASLISSAAMARLAAELRERYHDRVVVLDAPPLLATPEPLSLAQMADAVVLVIGARSTPRRVVQQALDALPREKVLGVVLNGVDFDKDALAGAGYYYGAEDIDEGGATGAIERPRPQRPSEAGAVAARPAPAAVPAPANGERRRLAPAAGSAPLGDRRASGAALALDAIDAVRAPADGAPATADPADAVSPRAGDAARGHTDAAEAHAAGASAAATDDPGNHAAGAHAAATDAAEAAAVRARGEETGRLSAVVVEPESPRSAQPPPGPSPPEGARVASPSALVGGPAASAPLLADPGGGATEAHHARAASSLEALRAGVHEPAPTPSGADPLRGLDWLFESGAGRLAPPAPDSVALTTRPDPAPAIEPEAAPRADRAAADPPPLAGGGAEPVFPGQRARLVVVEGSERGKAVEVVGISYAIGRSPSADITLADESISRRNCRLFWVQEALWLVDLRSTNGTYVNGERVLKKRLALGDEIRVGSTVLVVEAPIDDPWELEAAPAAVRDDAPRDRAEPRAGSAAAAPRRDGLRP